MTKRILITILSLPAIVAAGFFIATAHAQSPQATDVQGKFAGTLVTTTNPARVEAQLKGSSIQPRAKSKLRSQDRTMYVLDEPFVAPQVLALERNVFGTKTQPNYTYQTTLTPNDTEYSDQWNLPKISAPSAWDITTGTSDTTIAVLDTGILFTQEWDGGSHSYSQPDFPTSKRWENTAETLDGADTDDNGFIDDLHGWDFMGGFRGPDADCPNLNDASTYEDGSDSNFLRQDNDPQPYSCDSPDHPTELNKEHFNGTCQAFESACFVGHGTMAASVASAATNNNTLIAGVDHNAKLMNLRVLDGYGFGTSGRVLDAIDYATTNGADVINMSLALFSGNDCTVTDSAVEDALSAAKDAGIVSVAAAGNTGTQGVCYPAKSPHVIAVGATNSNDQRASFSSWGPELDVMAPGAGVPVANAPSAASNTDYRQSVNGTSFSSPHVAGLVGLVKALDQDITLADSRDILRRGADKIPEMNGANKTNKHGYGRINALSSLQLAKLIHPDGTLVREPNNPRIYKVEDEQLSYIPGMSIFLSYRFTSGQVKTSTFADTQLPTATNLPFREGTLLRGSGSAIYVVNYDSSTVEKRHITSMNVFNGLGYTKSDIFEVASSALPASNGDSVSSASIHPDGTLVRRSGQATVYTIENGQRRRIPSMDIFDSHRFAKAWVKNATSGDMALPTATNLPFREGTLLRGSGSAIYVVNYDGANVEKRHITSMVVFNTLGYTKSDIFEVASSALPTSNGDPVN